MRWNVASKDTKKTPWDAQFQVSLSLYLQDFPASSGKVRRSERISTSEEGWVRDYFTGINTALDHGTGQTAPEWVHGGSLWCHCEAMVYHFNEVLVHDAVPECWKRQMSCPSSRRKIQGTTANHPTFQTLKTWQSTCCWKLFPSAQSRRWLGIVKGVLSQAHSSSWPCKTLPCLSLPHFQVMAKKKK